MLLDLIDLDKLRRGAVHMLMMLAVVALQTHVFSRITVFGVRAMYIPAAVVAVGMLEGGVYGGLVGLFAGLLGDMAFSENLVLFTIMFPLIGMTAGALADKYVNKRYFSYLLVSLAALLVTACAQMFGQLVFAGANPLDLTLTALMQALWSMPLAAVIYFPYNAIAKRAL